MKNIIDKSQIVYNIISQIPQGKVVTYKKVASISGIKTPRLIGTILHQNKDPENIPCHRVIRSDGTLASNYAFGGKSEQKRKLESEGITFKKNKIMANYLWDFSLPIINRYIH